MVLIDIVDENDDFLKKVDKKDKLSTDITRSAGVMVFNSKGEILLQLRAKDDKSYPNCWDISAAGGVDLGESYVDCAKRELFEEIGIKSELNFVDKYFYGVESKYFASLYTCVYDGDFNLEEVEVSEVKFFSINDLKKLILNKDKFHPECLFVLEKYFLLKKM